MNYFFYFISFLFSLGQLGRITLYERQLNFYIYEIFLIFYLFILVIKNGLIPLKIIFEKYRRFFIFFLIMLVSLINEFWRYSLFQNLIGFLYFLRLLFYGLLAGYFFHETRKNPDFKKVIKNSINIIVFLTIITTTTQYFLYPNLRNLMYLGWDPHLERTFGVFFDTSIAGVFYGVIFFINNNIFVKLIYSVFLLLSFARSVILSFFISLFFFFFQNKISLLRFFFILVIFLGALFLIPKPAGEGGKLTRIYTINSRINDYKEGIKIFSKKPFLGWGYNRLRYVRGIYQSNAGSNFSSSYLTILATTGIIGFLSLISLIKFIFIKSKNSRPVLLFILTASLFDNIFLHPFILFILIISLFRK